MGESEEILRERYATPLKSAEILIGKKKLRAFAYRAESLLPKAQRLLNEVDILLKILKLKNRLGPACLLNVFFGL
jgi:hypothetical protein